MAETSIQWTSGPNGELGYTFNPWVGCQRVSPGCEHCYAEAYDKRVGGAPARMRTRENVPVLRWGPRADRVRTSVALWKQPLKWNREAAAAAQRRKVFCASLADVFDLHESIDSRWRLELFSLIRQTPHLDWLLLTKRPENFAGVVEQALSQSARVQDRHAYMGSPEAFEETRLWLTLWRTGAAPKNVWVGTTVEDQRRANERIPELLKVPAVVRFLSCEPLLEDVTLDVPRPLGAGENFGIDWVICGGESGAGARAFDLEWARSLREQANTGGASFFMKQLGVRTVYPAAEFAASIPVAVACTHGFDVCPRCDSGKRARHLTSAQIGAIDEWPLDLRVREFPEVRR